MDDLDEIEIETSRTRLVALAVFALICFGGGLLNLTPLFVQDMDLTVWAYVFGLFCLLFLAWAIAAIWVACTQPKIAYRLNPHGLFLGNHTKPAFTWAQVRGATLARGKRRNALVIILENSAGFYPVDLYPRWLSTFLGRPTDRDLALTNMDTRLDFKTFLDLIEPYLNTYGPQPLAKG